VKSYSYRERAYAFGQLILTLRTRIGLTQEGLGEPLTPESLRVLAVGTMPP